MCIMMGKCMCKSSIGWIIVLITLIFELGPSGGHEIIKFVVPLLADPRENVRLTCHYSMGSDRLYSAKWFKDDQEIFRYMPGQEPTGLSFPVNGSYLARTPHCSLISCDLEMTNITISSAGQYRCEISGEGPTFAIAQKTANITVAALPQKDPRVEGLASRYSLGDEIRVNCTSDPSLPHAELTWFVNDRQVSFLNVQGPWESFSDVKGLISHSVSLRLPADNSLFRDTGRDGGVMKVQCVSELPSTLPTTQRRRQTTVLTSLMPPSHLTNEKLAWPGSAANQHIPTIKIIIIQVALIEFTKFLMTWRPCGIHLRSA